MNIKILSDSTCDLPELFLKEHNITLTPLTVVKGDQEYKDGISICPADIFAHVASGGALCSTSAISVGEYQDYFASYSRDYDGVIQVCIGSGFSTCYQDACLAAEDFPNVRVIDSRNLTMGQGFVVLKAVELAKTASSLDELAQELVSYTDKLETSFVVDKLDYLVKGGRCSSAAALGANLLNLKPCIELRDNRLIVGKKYRGNLTKCLCAYVKERISGREDIDWSQVFVIHTTVSEECLQAVYDALNQYGHFQQILEGSAGCTISCHCGPGTLGILFVRK